MKTSQFMPGAFAAITGSFCLRHCNAMNVSGRNGLPWCSNLLCKNLLTFPVFNYQLALCWVYTGACCGLFMWAITSLDFNEWTRSNSLEPPHERKQTEQRGNVENIPDCACMHALFLSQAALFVLMFILGEQTTASSEAGSDGENRQFFAITSQAVDGLKHEMRQTFSLEHAYTVWVVMRNALLEPSCLRNSPIGSMGTVGVHAPGSAASLLHYLFRFQHWPMV